MACSPERAEARGQVAGSRYLWWAAVGFALSLLIPSTAIVQRRLGLAGVTGYLLVASAAFLLLVQMRHPLAGLASRITRSQVFWLAGSTFLLLLVSFLLVYPVADSDIAGSGTDNDDALDIATRELLHGRFPYYAETYLGNLPAQLPGALVLAVPFVLLGYSAYQNLFWLLAFFIAMIRVFGDGRLALLLVWAPLALSPVVLYEVLVGSDRLANGLYVLLAVLWMVRAIAQPDLPGWKAVVPAIFLGIALASRANFLLLLPLILAAMVRAAGWKRAVAYAAITGTIVLALTLPFYLYDPQGFSPLDAAAKLDQLDPVLPSAGLLVPLAGLSVALGLAACNVVGRGSGTLLRDCALVLALPVLSGILLLSIRFARPAFAFASYGTFFLFFGAAAFWGDLFAGTALEVVRPALPDGDLRPSDA